MKYLLITLCLGSAALSGCSKFSDPAISSKPGAPKMVTAAPPPVTQPPSNEQISKSLVAKYDVNKDNTVTTQEMLSVTVGDLLKHSARNDKTLTAEEFHAALGDPSAEDKDISKIFEKVDADHNNVLSEQELSEYVWPSIVAMDATESKRATAR